MSKFIMYFVENNTAGDKRPVKVDELGNLYWCSIYERDLKHASNLTKEQEEQLWKMVEKQPNCILERI